MDLALYKDPTYIKKSVDEEILTHITQRCNKHWPTIIYELLISWKKSLPEDSIQHNYVCEKLIRFYSVDDIASDFESGNHSSNLGGT